MAVRRRRKKSPFEGIGILVMILVIAMAVIWVVNPPVPREPSFTVEDFALEGDRMTCLSQWASTGIDVSRHQGQIDWAQVKASGIDFAFVRVGYRSAADGTLKIDDMAQRNLTEAKLAGLQVGAYFFSQAVSPEEARQEAAFAMEQLRGHTLDLPLAYDWEYVQDWGRTLSVPRETLADCINAFCSEIEARGYQSMVYFNGDFAKRMLAPDQLGRRIWFAMYDTHPKLSPKPDYWQYTDQGQVPGISGNVDLNLRFK